MRGTSYLNIYGDQLHPMDALPLPDEAGEEPDENIEKNLEERLGDEVLTPLRQQEIFLILRNDGSLRLTVDRLTILDSELAEQNDIVVRIVTPPSNGEMIAVRPLERGEDSAIGVCFHGNGDDFHTKSTFHIQVEAHTDSGVAVRGKLLLYILPTPKVEIDGPADIARVGDRCILCLPLRLLRSSTRIRTAGLRLRVGTSEVEFFYSSEKREPGGVFSWDSERSSVWQLELEILPGTEPPNWLFPRPAKTLEENERRMEVAGRTGLQPTDLLQVIEDAHLTLSCSDGDRIIAVPEPISIVALGRWTHTPTILSVPIGIETSERVKLNFHGEGVIMEVDPDPEESLPERGGSSILPFGSVTFRRTSTKSIEALIRVPETHTRHSRSEILQFALRYVWEHPALEKPRQKTESFSLSLGFYDRGLMAPVVGIDYGALTSCVYADQYKPNGELERSRYSLEPNLFADETKGSPIAYPHSTLGDPSRGKVGRRRYMPSSLATKANNSSFDSVLYRRPGDKLFVVGKEAEEEWARNSIRAFGPLKPHLGTDHYVQVPGKEYSARDLVAYFYEAILRDIVSGAEVGAPPRVLVLTHPVSMNLKAKREVHAIGEYLRKWLKEQHDVYDIPAETEDHRDNRMAWKLRNIDEATAVALFFDAFGSLLLRELKSQTDIFPHRSEEEYLLVVDVGASTTDISALRVRQLSEGGKQIETVEVDGLQRFGGNNLTGWIARQLHCHCFKNKTPDQVAAFPIWDETGCAEWFQTHFPELPVFLASDRILQEVDAQKTSRQNGQTLLEYAEVLKFAVLEHEGDHKAAINYFRDELTYLTMEGQSETISFRDRISTRERFDASLENIDSLLDELDGLFNAMAPHVREVISRVERVYESITQHDPGAVCWLILSGQGARFRLFRETIAKSSNLVPICEQGRFIDLAKTSHAKNCVAIGAWVYGDYLRKEFEAGVDGQDNPLVQIRNTIHGPSFTIGQRVGLTSWRPLLSRIGFDNEGVSEWRSEGGETLKTRLTLHERHGHEEEPRFNEKTDYQLGIFDFQRDVPDLVGEMAELHLWLDRNNQLFLEIRTGDESRRLALFEDYEIPSSRGLT